ncbi:MAG: hypothetical protein K4304_03670 [Propionicimonas sp.]
MYTPGATTTSQSGWDLPGYYAAQLLPEQVSTETGARLLEPGIVDPRPQKIGDILGSAFRAVRYAPMTMFGLTLVVMLVTQLIGVGIGYLVDRQATLLLPEDELGSMTSLVGWTVLISSVGVSVATVVVEMGLAYAVHEAVFARRTTPAAALRRLLSRAGAALVFSVLTGTAALVATAGTVMIAGILAGIVGDGGWWTLLVLVPALLVVLIWFGIRLMLAPCAIAIEKAGPIQAIRRSWRLTNGLFWRTFGIYLLSSVLISLAASTVSSVFSFAGMLVGLGDLGIGMIVSTTASTLVSTVLSVPLTSAVVTLLYVDARIRQEGYDLEIAEALYG